MNDICIICNETYEPNGLIVCDSCDEQGYELSTAYEAGIKYALNYLSDLYDGITETDLYKQYSIENEGN